MVKNFESKDSFEEWDKALNSRPDVEAIKKAVEYSQKKYANDLSLSLILWDTLCLCNYALRIEKDYESNSLLGIVARQQEEIKELKHKVECLRS